MPGIPKEFAEHKLHIREDAKPVKQPLRRLSKEKHRIVGEEIARLLAVGFIMEVFFPEWLANPVLVLSNISVVCDFPIIFSEVSPGCHLTAMLSS